jgi:hypothetical protein
MVMAFKNAADATSNTHSANLTELTPIDNCPHLCRPWMMWKSSRIDQNISGFLDNRKDLVCFLRTNSQSLLAQHPLSGSQRGNRPMAVHRRRKGDVDRIDIRTVDSFVEIRRTIRNIETILPVTKFAGISASGNHYFMTCGTNRFDHAMGNTPYTEESPLHYIDAGTKNHRMVSTVQIVYATKRLGRNTLNGTFEALFEYRVLNTLQ